jgi:hypothetical protein
MENDVRRGSKAAPFQGSSRGFRSFSANIAAVTRFWNK